MFLNLKALVHKPVKFLEEKIRFAFVGTATLLSVLGANGQAPADPSSIIGKVVCGYQGWFSATGDGSPINRWTHWSPGTAPRAGVAPNPNPNLTFDAYPDVSIYSPGSLFQTGFANQGNGMPSQLFSSFKTDVTDKHFSLLQTHGIDGVAFQRFIWEVLVDPAFKANRDSMAVHVRAAAEKYQRMFYLVYDLSGLGNVPAASDQARFDSIKSDWQNNMIGNLQFTSSPMYAKQGGKPVVQLWGIGYNHIIGTAAIQLDLINWFKAQGCYVIIGVPTGWRTGTGASKAGWINTYKAGNMISPWSVGAYSNQSTTDNFKTNFLAPDLTYCNSNGLAYQPVIFPGFSWANWNGGAQNQIPRNKGEFLWRQATNLRSLNIKSAEIAMLDEFDEGTAMLPMADGYSQIPTDQYFVTTSADGTYLSSDFYMRLATSVSNVIKGTASVTTNVTVPYSVGPVFFRTSNETKYDAMPSWLNSTDLKSNVTNYGSNSGSPTCATAQENPHSGKFSLKISGRDRATTTSYAYFKVWDVNIPVTSATQLSFWNYPLNALGRYVSIDLTMTDGSTLRGSGAVDLNGISMHPAAGRGTVNAWTQTICKIGTWLNGKTIDKIIVAYDNAPSSGDFRSYIDDISIDVVTGTQNRRAVASELSFSAKAVHDDVQLTLQIPSDKSVKQYEIERSIDGVLYSSIKTLVPEEQLKLNSFEVKDVNVMQNFKNAGQFYYRLKGIESDGKHTYKKVISLKNANAFQQVSVVDNKSEGTIKVRLGNGPHKKAFVSLYDASGKLLAKQVFYNPGSSVELKTSSMPETGIFLLQTQVDGIIYNNKMLR